MAALVTLAAKKEGGYSAVTFIELGAKLGKSHPHVIKTIGGKSEVSKQLKIHLKSRYMEGLTSEEARVFNQVAYSSSSFDSPVKLVKRRWTNEF